jgi:hypothetical protein
MPGIHRNENIVGKRWVVSVVKKNVGMWENIEDAYLATGSEICADSVDHIQHLLRPHKEPHGL